MGILIPFHTHSDEGIDSEIVRGGLEKFISALYHAFDDVEIVQITKQDRANRRAKQITEAKIMAMVPDLILINELGHYNHVKNFGIRTIVVCHEPLDRSIRHLAYAKIIREIVANGDHLYFVSERQFMHYQAQMKRISDLNLTRDHIKGFFNPSYCQDMPYSEAREHECLTVGRNSPDKDPFHLHRIMQGHGASLIITDDPIYKGEGHNAYVAKNRDWVSPQNTLRDLPHPEVLDIISKSKVYVSTCPVESWGITALESFGCGVPLVIATDKTGKHSSEGIAPDISHYIKVPKNASNEEFRDAIETMAAMSSAKRREMSDMTTEKHSFKNWKKQFDNAFNLRYNENSRTFEGSTLENFF